MLQQVGVYILPVGIPEAIRTVAQREGLTLEALRKKGRFANGTFYNLLAGRAPRVVRTLEKLKAIGVVVDLTQ